MNTTELKALAEDVRHAMAQGHKRHQAEDALKDAITHDSILALIADLESAQYERRALLATEQNLRERVKALEDGLRGLLVGCEYLSIGGDLPAWHAKQMPSNAALDSARALLEKTT